VHLVAIGVWGFELQKDVNTTNDYTSWMLRVPPVGRAIADGDVFRVDWYNDCMANCNAKHTSLDIEKSKYPNMARQLECQSGLKFINESYTTLAGVNETVVTWCDMNNFFPYVQTKEDWLNQYLSSFYWSLTMLMKTPFVGPDTVTEKFFACFVVILGAILFALLLGQFTAFLNSMGKTSAMLRDQIGAVTTFCATRNVPSRLRTQLVKQIRADWTVTLGMDSGAILKDFPYPLRVEVLNHVYAPLLQDACPGFLRCSEQLKLQILTLFKPGVALKKETIVNGGHFGSTVYILLKGTLQCSLSQHIIEEQMAADENSSPMPGNRPSCVTPGARQSTQDLDSSKGRATSMGGAGKGKGKGMKDKAKVRMLERPGAVIPHAANLYSGARPSSFNVSSILQSRILTFEASDLAKILDQHEEADADMVAEALEKDYLSLLDSLKVKPPGKPGDKKKESSGRTASDDKSELVESVSSRRAQKAKAAKGKAVPKAVELENKLTKLEGDVQEIIKSLDNLTHLTHAIPEVLGELARRFVPPDTPAGGTPASAPGVDLPGTSPANTSSADETPQSSSRSKGGFFGFGNKN